jgi:glycosyltransferase involved in cell wall biosynthesis
MAAQMAWGTYDLIYYPPFGRQRKLFNLFKMMGEKKRTVFPVEAIAQQILAVAPPLQKEMVQALFTANARYAISANIAKTMEENFGLPMQVIPLGVDTQTFSFIDRRKRTLPVKIINLATIQPRKQTHLILDLAQHINPEIAQFHIFGDVLGDPSYYNMLLKRKEDEALTNVYFHGKILHHEVPSIMKKYDILVLPSRLEGVPKVTLEAAATGMPCIIFDDYQSPSVIDGLTGFQVKTFGQMIERLQLLLENQELRLEMGTEASQYVQKFDWNTVIMRLENYFKILVVSG